MEDNTIDFETEQVESKRIHSKPVLAVHKKTGDMKAYATIKAAAEATGVSEFLIQMALKDPMHHSHREAGYDTNYVVRGNSLATRQRLKYCEYDFQPYDTIAVTAYAVDNKDEKVSFTSGRECIDKLMLRESTFYKRKHDTKPGLFSLPIRGADKRRWLLVFSDDKERNLRLSAPTYEEVMQHYDGVTVKSESETEFLENPEELSVAVAREIAKEKLPEEEVRAIMEEAEREDESDVEEQVEDVFAPGGKFELVFGSDDEFNKEEVSEDGLGEEPGESGDDDEDDW